MNKARDLKSWSACGIIAVAIVGGSASFAEGQALEALSRWKEGRSFH